MTDTRQYVADTPTPATHCTACGKSWIDHPGIARTCEALLQKCRETVALESERDALNAKLEALRAEGDAALADYFRDATEMMPTQRTDAVAKAIGSLAARWKTGAISAADFASHAQDAINSVTEERDELDRVSARQVSRMVEAEGNARYLFVKLDVMKAERDAARADSERLLNALELEAKLHPEDFLPGDYRRAAIDAARKDTQ
jgi:hypothetical protein